MVPFFYLYVNEYNCCLEMISLNWEINLPCKKVKNIVLIWTNFLFSDSRNEMSGQKWLIRRVLKTTLIKWRSTQQNCNKWHLFSHSAPRSPSSSYENECLLYLCNTGKCTEPKKMVFLCFTFMLIVSSVSFLSLFLSPSSSLSSSFQKLTDADSLKESYRAISTKIKNISKQTQ